MEGEQRQALIEGAWAWLDAHMGQSAAHDRGHVQRVVANARAVGAVEGGDGLVIELAAILHDNVDLPKDDPRRKEASTLGARRAMEWLDGRLSAARVELVGEAIRCHSYSAGIEAQSLEAQVVSDADNLDALGAIGIARAYEVGGSLGRRTLDVGDPLCRRREPDDQRFSTDHFFVKLLGLKARFYTDEGKRLAQERVDYMRDFLGQLEREVTHQEP